jgi:hypothetical protein
MFQQADGTLTPFAGGAAETYNFGARNHYQRPVERWNLGASGHYEISGGLEAYADTSYMKNVTTAQIAESGRHSTDLLKPTVTTPCFRQVAVQSGAGSTHVSLTFTGTREDGVFTSL